MHSRHSLELQHGSLPSPPKQRISQGEHALWVGNIPSSITIMRLRDYFSAAMPTQQELLSISYNPDARYAFINFGTESARMLAIQQAAYQLLDEKRLDCRIRQSGTRRSTKVNYGLEAGRPGQSISIDGGTPDTLQHKVDELSHYPEADTSLYGQEKCFILKSYSLETLYRSLASGLWHVPKRHVERLNHAFQTASKVYLIFSVNGSGQFFGYATMRAEIREAETLIPFSRTYLPGPAMDDIDDQASIDADNDSDPDFASRRHSLGSCDTTCSTGSITYEPERRKITWHAPWAQPRPRERSLSDLTSPISTNSSDPFSSPQTEVPHSGLPNFSLPCEIKWLSTQSLPFDEIRGLRNGWNSNKEVHIARNVTPVEPVAAVALLRHWRVKDQSVRAGSGSPKNARAG